MVGLLRRSDLLHTDNASLEGRMQGESECAGLDERFIDRHVQGCSAIGSMQRGC